MSLQRTQFEATQKDATGAMVAQFAYDRDQRKLTFDHERRLEDLKEARSVLDDAARRLHRADAARRALIQDTRNADKKSTLGQAGIELDELQQRIAIRFGQEDPITLKFGACVAAVLGAYGATQFGDLKEAAEQGRELSDAGSQFETALPAFIEAAVEVAGVDVG